MPIDLDQFGRGSVVRTSIQVCEVLDGTPVSIPVVVMRGSQPGPTLYLGSTIHGDEITGIEVIRRALELIDPRDLRGTILAVPVQNPLAFRERQRFLPTHSIEGFYADVNMAFPGTPDGEVASVTAHRLLNDLVLAADAAIDLHTPLHGGEYVDHALAPSPLVDLDGKARELSLSFGTSIVIVSQGAAHTGSMSLRDAATLAGVPTFTVEFKVSGRVTEPSVTIGVTGILNVLSKLGMIAEPVRSPERQIIAHETMYARAQKGGMAEILCELGQEVRKGDLLARIRNLTFEIVELVEAPCDGIIYRLAVPGPLHSTERVAGIVIPIEDQK